MRCASRASIACRVPCTSMATNARPVAAPILLSWTCRCDPRRARGGTSTNARLHAPAGTRPSSAQRTRSTPRTRCIPSTPPSARSPSRDSTCAARRAIGVKKDRKKKRRTVAKNIDGRGTGTAVVFRGHDRAVLHVAAHVLRRRRDGIAQQAEQFSIERVRWIVGGYPVRRRHRDVVPPGVPMR